MNASTNSVSGYTSHSPAKDTTHGGEYVSSIKNHIPGYMGYIPHVRAENMFGKTYGNLTHVAKNDPQASKNFSYSQGRSTVATFPAKRTGGNFYGTGKTAKNEISETKKSPIGISFKELQAKAYGI